MRTLAADEAMSNRAAFLRGARWANMVPIIAATPSEIEAEARRRYPLQGEAVQDVNNGIAVLVIPRASVVYPDGHAVHFEGSDAEEAARRILCRGSPVAMPVPAHTVR